MDKEKSEEIALALLAAGEMAHAFSAFLPSRFTIRNWVMDGTSGQLDQNVRNLRSGYLPALAFGLGLGGVISLLTGSKLPLVFSAGTGAAMVALYEQAFPPELRTDLLSTIMPERAAAPQITAPAGG